MRKNFGAKPFLYPQPVMILGSYDVLSGPAQPGNGGKTDVFVAVMHELDQLILFPLLNTFFDFFQFPHTASTFLRCVPKADVFFPCIQ